jgi:integrase
MKRDKTVVIEPQQLDGCQSALNWQWPVSPRVFKVYDKYADVEFNLFAGAATWEMSVHGRPEVFKFASGKEGLLQQKLVMLTQVDRSPSSILKFTRTLLRNWHFYLQLLESGPAAVLEHWDVLVTDIDKAKTAKTLLRFALRLSLGKWRVEHEDMVKGLDARANSSSALQRGRLVRREKLLSIEKQSQLVRVLDICSPEPEMSESQAEGLAALALTFQHGMRSVQLLSLLVEHVNIFTDASDSPVCLVSFHTAKQKEDRTVGGEMARQIMPGWANPLSILLSYAKEAGRTRVFCLGTSQQLWAKVKRVCGDAGFKVDFNAGSLRHSSAQALADAGHSRKSIQWFLGHSNSATAAAYIRASLQQGNLINAALGTSKLYGKILSIANGQFVTVEELSCVPEDEQIGAVVGHRLVAGIGRCRSGQSTCIYDPVSSCYGCSRYMPALNPLAHMEAIAGMREQVVVFFEA